MGREKSSKYHRDLKQIMNDKLTEMLHNGEGTSKKEAMKNGTADDKIFSYSTYKSYFKHCRYYADWLKVHYPEATSFKKSQKHVVEWLKERSEQVDENGKHLSAWTILLERQALCKLYGISPDDSAFYVEAPKRHREDIVRSRVPVERDRHFSESNNKELIDFCRGTGCRRNILENLKGKDFYKRESLEEALKELKAKEVPSMDERRQIGIIEDALSCFPDQDHFILHRGDKGGRSRFSPIIGRHTSEIVERMLSTAPDELVWKSVPVAMDVHSYRGEYATDIYKMYARDIKDIPYDRINHGTGKRFQSEVYRCRKDEKGKVLDKKAMLLASKALGHNRIEIVANNYIRGL